MKATTTNPPLALLLLLVLAACNTPAIDTDAAVAATVAAANPPPAVTEIGGPTEVVTTATATLIPDSGPTDTPTVAATATATAMDPAAIPASTEVYTTDFASGWPDLDFASTNNPDRSGSSTVETGGYLLKSTKEWGHFAFTSNVTVGEFDIEVTVTPRTCPEESDSGYGVMFSYQDSQTFNYVLLRCNGNLWVFDLQGDNSKTLYDEPSGIDTRSGSHTLRVVGYSGNLIVFIDGAQRAQVEHDAFANGSLGPYVRGLDTEVSALYADMVIGTFPGE